MSISEKMQAPYEEGPPSSLKGYKLPFLKFFPDDWRKDPQLGMCSLMARGLWFEMLLLMFRSDPQGFLLVSGVKPTINQLAILVRSDQKSVKKSLSELRDFGVFSEDERGVIYSRRMVSDCVKALIDMQNGSKGGPRSWRKHAAKGVNLRDDPSVDTEVNHPDNAKNTEDRNQKSETKETDSPEEKTGEEKIIDLDASHPGTALTPNHARDRLAKGARGTRLPDGWMPNSEDRRFAADLGLDVDVVAATFVDYWHSEWGPKALKLSWSGVWRNWCRRENNSVGAGSFGRPKKPSVEDRIMAASGLKRSDVLGFGPVIDLDPIQPERLP